MENFCQAIKRKKEGKKRERTRRGRDEEGESEREREKRERGESNTFLLPPLLAMKAISIVRRREERGEGRA